MAPGSATIPLLLLSAAASHAAAAGAAPAACSNISGLYAVGREQGGNEVMIWQPVGCNWTATDLEGVNVSGWVVGNNMTLNFYRSDQSVNTEMGVYDPSTMSFTTFKGNQTLTFLPRINCTRAFIGFWSNGVNTLAISQAPNCTGTMFSSAIGSPPMPIAVVVNGTNATFMVNGSLRALSFRFPRTVVIGSEPPYKITGTYPCFRASDFTLNPKCFSDLVTLGQNGTFTALNASLAEGNETFSTVHQAYCVPTDFGEGTADTCEAPCTWRLELGGWCRCPDEASCVAAGYGWITRAYPCDDGFSDQMTMATSDCCSGGPDFCQPIGVDPYGESPEPEPQPSPAPGAGCTKLPSSTIQQIEASTKYVVRRCGATPPSPPYWPPSPDMPSPSPYMGPSPGMMPPPSPYMPSPSPYMGPSPSMVPPSPSYRPPSPSPSYKTPSPVYTAPSPSPSMTPPRSLKQFL